MKDMERQKFESEWKEAFEQAEISPSDNLWTSIELDLEREDGKKMRQRLLHYKLMAAASVFLAMCFAGGGFYYLNNQRQSGLMANSTVKSEVNDSNTVTDAHNTTNGKIQGRKGLSQEKEHENFLVDESNESELDAISEATQKFSNGNSGQAFLSPNRYDRKESGVNQTLLASKSPTSSNVIKSTPPEGVSKRDLLLQNTADNSSQAFTYRSLPVLVNIPKIKLHLREEEEDPFKLMMARLQERELELAKSKDDEISKKAVTERLWTSVGLSAGSFYAANSNVNSSALSVSSSTFSSADAANNQSKASGTSYSAGLNVGTKISERWVLQGGVNYMAQTSAYQSNAVVGSDNLQSFRAASLTDLNNSKANSAKEGKLVATSNYNISNSLQYVSVPIQAGYVAVNHALALQINAGVSTDLFIQNTITPENSSNVGKVTQGRGENSPYRPLNFSGLFGTEISYRFGKHYRLALNPGLRYPLNSIYKSGTGVASNPLTMDVGMRFRYIFQ